MKILFLLLFVLQMLSFAESVHEEKIKLQLQWKFQFQFAGFIMAKELGYYKQEGLDVELIEYKNTSIMQDLMDEKVDYALANSIISYKNKKLREITLVATYFQKSPLVLLAQSDIKSIMDLKNKKIMISQDNRENSSLSILFEYFGITPQNNTFLKPSFNLEDFIQKRVDVITAFRSNEIFTLDARGIDYTVIDPIEYGFSTNAINLFVSHKRIQEKPQEIEAFLHASKKGWQYALHNIEKTAALIHTKYQPNKSLEHLIYEGKLTKELMLLHLYEIGEVNKDFVLRTYNKLLKENRLAKDETPEKLFMKRENLQEWIHAQYIQRTEYTFAIVIASFFLILVGLLLFWSLKMKKEIAKRLQAEHKLTHQAHHDALTNLPNRTLFLDRLAQAMKSAKRENTNVAVVYIDLDHFKEVNDSLGHTAGDILLQKVATLLSSSLRNSDTVARVGGDEFIIILNDFTQINHLTHTVNTIVHALKKPLRISKQEIYVELSIGIAVYPDDGIDADTLIKNADAAMYKAKDNGRNNYQFYTADMTQKAFERIVLETQLRQSIQHKQLEVYYQIQVDAKKKIITGMEALVRWNHPLRGLLSPNDFIPIAEETGFIVELDAWVMRDAIVQFQQWREDGYKPGVLSLNLSIIKLEKEGFIQNMLALRQKFPEISEYVSFELTESQIMKNPEEAIENLNHLSKMGFQLAIDDFGTGHSSLAYLKKLPINKLKIDRSFIKDIPYDTDDKEITKTIIAMAKNLHLSVIAEGVETQEQNDFLLENDCSEIQGYLYHKPAPAHEIKERLQNMFK